MCDLKMFSLESIFLSFSFYTTVKPLIKLQFHDKNKLLFI